MDPRITERMPDAVKYGRTLALCHVGSISHGTHTPSDDPNSTDDVDVFGITIPEIRYVLGLDSWEHWVTKFDELDVTFFSVQKFFRLLLKNNPNVLSVLWLPDKHFLIEHHEFKRIRKAKMAFSSKAAYKSFSGYAYDQLRKLESGAYKGYMGEKRRALVKQYGYDPKNAAHLIRLLRMGIEFLQSGWLYVDRTDIDADELKAIKRGEWTLNKIQNHASDLFKAAEAAYAKSTLPEAPDRERIEEMLIDLQWDFYGYGVLDADGTPANAA